MRKPLIAVAALALAGAAGYLLSNANLFKGSAATSTGSIQLPWVAAAPGRVEPKSGEIRIGASQPGRIAEILARINDQVEEGELLIRLDDAEARARLAAAEAEAGARKQERDAAPAVAGRDELRRAEDAVFAAERALTGARFELDFALSARRTGGATGTAQMVQQARKRLTDARERLQRDRVAVATAQSKPGVPAPNRAESALSAARAEVAMAEAILDKTRVRASIGGTVLQLGAKLGEMVAPTADQPLIVLGDMSLMRVKAEVDEGDVSKIKLGQKAFVRSTSYPGKDFEGRVTAFAPSLAPPRIGLRGPRRPTDVEVLEVTIDLDGNPALLPGMRVDAFFRREQQ
jgi:HlyD family secretion protein